MGEHGTGEIGISPHYPVIISIMKYVFLLIASSIWGIN